MTQEACYVFSDLGGTPRLVGRTMLEPGQLGSFQYARSFIESGHAFSLDPVNLPLRQAAHELVSTPYIFGALLDAGPDDWGRRALAHRGKPADGLDPLVYGSGSGVGTLLFSLSRDSVRPRPKAPSLADLTEMLEGVDDIERGRPLPDHIAKLLDAGTSMGGARPKAVVEHQGRLWLAKFPSQRDVLDQPRVEYATLRLARHAGLDVPDVDIQTVRGQSVMLIERFDTARDDPAHSRLHFLSMAAAMTIGRRLRPDAVQREQSYMGMAGFLVAHGARHEEDRRQLFRRMVFNVLIGHVDDHQRNHGFLLAEPTGGYRLSPAYDMAPSNGTAESVSVLRDTQAIGIGRQGALRTFENLMSATEEFGLDTAAARAEFDAVRAKVEDWRAIFKDSGVTQRDVDVLAKRLFAVPDLPQRSVPRAHVVASMREP